MELLRKDNIAQMAINKNSITQWLIGLFYGLDDCYFYKTSFLIPHNIQHDLFCHIRYPKSSLTTGTSFPASNLVVLLPRDNMFYLNLDLSTDNDIVIS